MIRNKEDYKHYIKLEIENYKESYPNLTMELINIIKFQKLYRKLEYYCNCKKNILAKIYIKLMWHRYYKLSNKYGFHIPINVIEEGLCIVHTGPIYINSHAKIGKFVRIHPMTVIGKNIGKDLSSPTIGNHVWIGSGAKIFGNIVIGNNVVIGVNSVVNKSFPANTTIAGAPAKIIKNTGYDSYFQSENNNLHT